VLAVTIQDGRLIVAERPDPEPGSGELLVRVAAAGVNPADLAQRAGHYPAPPGSPADIPGLELAGEVVAVGRGVLRFRPGDRVMSLVGGGGQAELAVVHERVAMPVPDRLDWPQAGGFPEVVTTAHDALFTQAGLGLGDRLLVHGAAGGVGTAAVQLAAAAGARVVASVHNRDHHAAVAALGAERVVEPAEAAAAGPFDVILELVGGPNLPADVEALATWGRITVIGTPAGSRVELDLRQLMAKRGRLLASSLRTRSLEEKADAARRVEAQALPLVAAGRLRIPVHATFPLAAAQEAYDRFAAGGKLGKLVLVTGSGSSSGPPAAPRPAA
jgi:putative PIG3 family NAD(P)H quinone oxidoreductase